MGSIDKSDKGECIIMGSIEKPIIDIVTFPQNG